MISIRWLSLSVTNVMNRGSGIEFGVHEFCQKLCTPIRTSISNNISFDKSREFFFFFKNFFLQNLQKKRKTLPGLIERCVRSAGLTNQRIDVITTFFESFFVPGTNKTKIPSNILSVIMLLIVKWKECRAHGFCRNWCIPILNSIINSSGGLKNRRIGMTLCWFERLLIPNRKSLIFVQYLKSNRCNKLVEVKMMCCTRITPKSMYHDTISDFE